MQFIKNTTWKKVFSIWKKAEISNPNIIKIATEIKSWPDWKSWRNFTAQQLRAPEREWKIFQFDDPLTEIPKMLLGPFSSWQTLVKDKKNKTFQELLNIPEQYEIFKKDLGISKIIKDLPFHTKLIGLIRKDTNQIVCLEGHHRATAISLIQKENKKINFSNHFITIALAEVAEEDCQIFDEVLKRSSNKIPPKK